MRTVFSSALQFIQRRYGVTFVRGELLKKKLLSLSQNPSPRTCFGCSHITRLNHSITFSWIYWQFLCELLLFLFCSSDLSQIFTISFYCGREMHKQKIYTRLIYLWFLKKRPCSSTDSRDMPVTFFLLCYTVENADIITQSLKSFWFLFCFLVYFI